MRFLPFLTKAKSKPIAHDELDEIITFTKDIVVRQDLIQGIMDDFAKKRADPGLNHLHVYVHTYSFLEDFILRNKPLVVQKSYTKDQLREEIRTKFDITKLPEAFRLIFLPENEQLFLLYVSYTRTLSEYIINQVGIGGLQNIITPVTVGTPFASLNLNDQAAMANLYQHLPEMKPEALTEVFKKVNTALYQHIAASFGEKTAFELTQKCYQEIKDTYIYAIIAQYLQAIPQGILEKERVAYMTRHDLEEQALVSAKDKLARETAEQSAKTLQEEKDIIEQKVKEQTKEITANFLQAQRNEAKLLASVKGLSLGFILTDTHNEIVISNQSAKSILKFSQDITSAREITAQLQNKIDVVATIDQCRNDNAPIELAEFEINDQILHLTFTPVFLTEPHTEFIGAVILINDITEEKRLERTKDEFFAIASHELRTPLTAIRGSVSILKNYYSDKIVDGDIPTLISYIDQSSIHLIDIVNEFLHVSRLEQGRIIFKNALFPVREVITDVVNELTSLAERKKLTLLFDESSGYPPSVFADKERVKQILINLVGNAIKFTDAGSVMITTATDGDHALIKVIDTGTGIATSNQKLLFRKFQQADENILTHDASKGTGLGLYISKKLIENMGGTIYLERSEPGKGSTFTFSLPLQLDASQ